MLKNADILQKNADITKTKGILILKGISSETTYVVHCAIWYQTLKNNILTVGQNTVLTS